MIKEMSGLLPALGKHAVLLSRQAEGGNPEKMGGKTLML